MKRARILFVATSITTTTIAACGSFSGASSTPGDDASVAHADDASVASDAPDDRLDGSTSDSSAIPDVIVAPIDGNAPVNLVVNQDSEGDCDFWFADNATNPTAVALYVFDGGPYSCLLCPGDAGFFYQVVTTPVAIDEKLEGSLEVQAASGEDASTYSVALGLELLSGGSVVDDTNATTTPITASWRQASDAYQAPKAGNGLHFQIAFPTKGTCVYVANAQLYEVN